MKTYASRISRVLLLLACAGNLNAAILKISPNSVTRQVSEVDGNYSTTHLYLNEVAAESIPITIFFDPQASNIETCEVFTNLNRRDRAQLDANGDGIEDGIKPVDGNLITAGNDNHYFKAYPMNLISGGFQLTLNATRPVPTGSTRDIGSAAIRRGSTTPARSVIRPSARTRLWSLPSRHARYSFTK